MMSVYGELKRRNVFRVGAAYVVAAWLLIQVAETIFPLFGFDDTPARVVVILLAIGLVPVLVFAWVFELTPEGLKREKDIDRSRSTTPHTGKKLDRAIMVVLAIAVGYFAVDKFVLSGARMESAREQGRSEALVKSYGDKSIAVLAFDDMSPEGDQGYLSDGIAEELLNLLAKIPELRVISRSSAFSFKGQNLKVSEIAERLNVAHILEGSVRKSGNRVRITAQLIDARTDTHLWSETYDRTLDNIFVIQDDIAATVVEQLRVTLLGEALHVTEIDPEAYALFLQARHLRHQMSAEDLERSTALFQQVLASAPGYAPAWDGMASNYINQADRGLRALDEGYALAREATETALSIDPEYASAHSALGWIAMTYDGDLVAAARHLEQALQLNPTDLDVLNTAAILLQSLGRIESAIVLAEYQAVRDPVNPKSHAVLGMVYLNDGRLDEALASAHTLLRLSPDYIAGQYFLGRVLLLKGETEAALTAMQQEAFEAYRMLGLVMAYHAAGNPNDSDAVLDEFIEKHEQGWAYNIAYVLAYRNEADQAFEWLDKAVEYGDPGLSDIVVEPAFSNIYSDSRWLPFLESIGKSPEQLDAIEFEVALPQ